MTELGDLFKAASQEKKKLKEQQENSPAGKALKSVQESLKSKNNIGEMMEIFVENKQPVREIVVEKIVEKEVIKEVVVNKDSFQQPAPQPVDPNIESIKRKVQFLEQAIGKIAATGPGSGEVNLRYLDDIDRSTIGEGRHLAYNATTKKFFFENVNAAEPQVQSDWNVTDNANLAFIKNKPTLFSGDYDDLTNKPTIPSEIVDDNATTDITSGVVSVINLPNSVIGPIQGMKFDTTHVHTTKDAGTLCWNDADRTLNIQHPNDVIQQVGQETYMLVRNNTGSTILNATSVRFSGSVGVDGEARITVAPFLADGTYPSLYAVGMATEDIANGADGFITVFGKVREINTTGSSVSETWALGDILYAHPTIAGALTRVKPTAPYNVVPMAAVVTVDGTDGEIFVRPTIEQKYSYGRFSRTTDFTFAATNTAYAITLDTTQISNGVTRGSPTSRMVVDQSGYYQVDATVQLDTTSNKGICYLWLRKNGTNVVNTTRREAIESADDVRNFSYTMEISLAAGDYIELCTAATSTDLRMDAAAATAFAPTTAGVLISVNQLVL